MKKFPVLLGILMTLTVPSAWAQEGESDAADTVTISFADALHQLYEANGMIKMAGSEKKQSEYEKKATGGLRFPHVSLSANYVAMSDPIHLDLTPVKDAITPLYQTLAGYGSFSPDVATPQIRQQLAAGLEQIEGTNWIQIIQKDRFGTVDATMFWPLFTGGKIDAANKAAEIKVEVADAKLKATSAEQVSDLVQRYFGLRLAEKVVEVRREVMEGMAKHLDDARKLEANGMIAAAERLHAEVAYADAEREFNKAQRDADLIRTSLQSTLEKNGNFFPSTSLFLTANLGDLEEFKSEALANNPGLSQIQSKKMLADQGIKKEKSAWYPDVYMMGTANVYNKDLSEYMPDWYVGVGLKFDLFDGRARVNKIHAARSAKDQVEAYERKVRFDIQTAVTKLYLEMQNDNEQYQSLGKSLEFADEYLRVKNKAFQQGLASSTDVVDASLNLSKTRIERLKVVYEFDVMLAKMLEICGRSNDFETIRMNNQGISYEQ
ncbi:TolC family protein [Prolixibacter bellariivorans]|nr:TolC family protein [Prolixibacter bellariivorans]